MVDTAPPISAETSRFYERMQQWISYEFPTCPSVHSDGSYHKKNRMTDAVVFGQHYRYGIVQNFDERCYHFYIMVENFEDARFLLDKVDERRQQLVDSVETQAGNAFIDEPMTSSRELVFSGRVYVYTNEIATPQEFYSYGASKRLQYRRRDQALRDQIWKARQDDLFLSHDSRDKAAVVDGLNTEFSRNLVKVWYDKTRLVAGDTLAEAIYEGLAECPIAVLVVTRNYLENKKWAWKEFEYVLKLGRESKKRRIVPLWYNVSMAEVEMHSPELAQLFAVSGKEKPEDIVQAIIRRVREARTPPAP